MASKYRKLTQELAHDVENTELENLHTNITDWKSMVCDKLELGEEQEDELDALILERMARGIDFQFEQELESLASAAKEAREEEEEAAAREAEEAEEESPSPGA